MPTLILFLGLTVVGGLPSWETGSAHRASGA